MTLNRKGLRAGGVTLSLTMTILAFSQPASAGLFDSIIDEAKDSVQQSIDTVIKGDEEKNASKGEEASTQSMPSSKAQSNKPKPEKASATNDKALVKSIQEQLNRHGFSAGDPDGLYGKNTARAIKAFQRDQDLDGDGLPSEELLSRLQSTSIQSATVQTNEHKEAPSTRAFTLAGVHFNPNLLDEEFSLKRIVLAVYPELQEVVDNEFKWHRKKEEIKSRILAEARDATLLFEVVPWREGSLAKARTIELKDYDFERSAFLARFATGTVRQMNLRLLTTSSASPKATYGDVDWFHIEPQKAEEIAEFFGSNNRRLPIYPHYRLRAVGMVPGMHKPVPTVEFVDDRIDLYALPGKKRSNNQGDYTYLASIKLPVKANEIIEKPEYASGNRLGQVTVTGPGASGAQIDGSVSELRIDGLGLSEPVFGMWQQLVKRGYEPRGQLDAIKKRLEQYPNANTTLVFIRRGKGRDQTIISYRGGKITRLQYELNSPEAWNTKQTLSELKQALGDSDSPCDPAPLVRCKWTEKNKNSARPGKVEIEFSKSSERYYFLVQQD